MKKQHKFALSILTMSVLSATVYAADTDSPFTMPLHLSNPGMHKTVTVEKTESRTKTATWSDAGGKGITKPNVMLYLDDSGSMGGGINGKTKFRTLQDVLKNLMDKEYQPQGAKKAYKYGEMASWGIEWMNSPNNSQDLTSDYTIVRDNISGHSRTDSSTPFMSGYVRAANKFANDIDLTCNNNYIIAMTDGAANQNNLNNVNSLIRSGSTLWNKAGVYSYELRDINGRNWGPRDFSVGGLNTLGKYKETWQYEYEFSGNSIVSSYYGVDGKWHDKDDLSPLIFKGKSNVVEDLDRRYLQQLSKPLGESPETNIKTYTVAFGLGKGANRFDERELERTRYMLEKGATGEGMFNGNKTYFEANDETGLQNAFEKMFQDIASDFNDSVDIQTGDPTTSAPNVTPGTSNISSISADEDQHALAAPAITGADKLFPQETVSLWLPIGVEGGLRSAELRFYKPNYTQDANGVWDEKLKMDTAYGVPNYQYASRVALMSEKEGRVRPMNDNFNGNNGYFALNHYNSPSDEWLKAMLPWQSRYAYDNSVNDRILNQTYTANTIYRERDYPMGDILESDIVTVGALVDEDQTVDFQGRKEFIVAAANDGLAYVFQSNGAAKTNNARNPYNLVMTYAPSELQRQKTDDTLATHYKDIAHKDYATTPERPHLYMLSGGITAHTLNKPFNIDYMLGNAGRGAKGLYAMNLSGINESRDYTSDVTLFNAGAHRGGKESDMGYTVGYPSTARFGVNVTRKNSNGRVERHLDNGIIIATAVGSGFSTKTNLANQETALYLYNTLGGADVGIEGCGYDKNDMTSNHKNSVQCMMGNKAKRGELLAKASMGKTGGLATPTLFDVDTDGVVDYAFAGDYSGNMWRCDVRHYTTFNDKDCKKIFEGTPDRPVTSAPIIARVGDEHVVMWGTGSDMFPEDVTETKRQALYGVYQKFDELNNVVNDKDKGFLDKTFAEGDLLTQKLNTVTGAWETLDLQRKVSDEDIDGKDGKRAYAGWVIELDANGERVVSQPMLSWHTVYFSTRVYGKSDKNPSAQDTQYDKNWTAKEWRENGWTVKEESNATQVCSTDGEDVKTGRGGWSIAQLIDRTQSTSSVWNKCNNASSDITVTTDVYQSQCAEQTQHKLTAEKSVEGGTPKLYSGLIQLNVINGGQIFPKRRDTSYVLMGNDRKNANEFGYISDGGLISSTTYGGFVVWMINDPTRKGYNDDKHGNMYQRGVYRDLDKNPCTGSGCERPTPENACIPDDGKIKAQLLGQGKEDAYQFGMHIPMEHVNCLRRISWREIY